MRKLEKENGFMQDQMQAGMAEATRLTREGRLTEATAMIQRALGGTYDPSVSWDGDGDERTEAAFYVVDEAARSAAPPRAEPDTSAPGTAKPSPSGGVAGEDLL